MLCHYLTPMHIVHCDEATTKADIIAQLTTTLCEQYQLAQEPKIFADIMAREDVGSTFLPVGVAIPHTRCNSVDDIKMVMGILPEGISGTHDGKEYPIRLVFLFVSPMADRDAGRHLKLLARIAAIFRTYDIVKTVAAAPTSDAAFAILQRFETDADALQLKARYPTHPTPA